MKAPHTILTLILLCLTLMLSTGCQKDTPADGTLPDNFAFSLTFGCYGISYYDSSTGKLIKTTDATHPEDYITTAFLTDEQLLQIWEQMQSIDIFSYPDIYDPNPGVMSSPTMTLVLYLSYTDAESGKTTEKKIACENIAISYSSDDRGGQKFLTLCRTVENMLYETPEWQALPDYEFFYD